MSAAAADPVAAPAAEPLVAFAFPTTVLTDAGGCGFVDAVALQIAVFDGHGEHGEAAATAACRAFAAQAHLVQPFTDLFESGETAVRNAIRAAANTKGIATMEEGGGLYRRGIYGARGAQIRGGTTASIVRFGPDGSLTVANVGNSDVVVFDSDTDPGRSLIAVADVDGTTRALGRAVIATPGVQTAPAPVITPAGTTRAVIIGSDGLWDTLHFEEARAIVYRADLVGRPDEGSAALMAYGKERALALAGATITCAVVYVMVAPAPPAAPPAFALPPPPADWIEDAAAPAILDCALHGPPMRNPRGLWYTANESGHYSMSAPRCNGCAHGVADACIADLAAAYHEALYAYRENPTEENRVAMETAHRERYARPTPSSRH